MAMQFPQAKVHACDDPKMIPVLRVWACDETCGPSRDGRVHEDIIRIERCDTCGFTRSNIEGVQGVKAVNRNPLTDTLDVVLDARP